MLKFLLILSVIGLSVLVFFRLYESKPPSADVIPANSSAVNTLPSSVPSYSLKPLLPEKILENDYHIFQTFNNCGPAALSMALSYYGIKVSQEVLGQQLRPYQNTWGDNDDKSVTLDELADKALEYNLTPYHRPNGSIELIKQFISYDMPVVTITLSKAEDDIGHYRVVKGYDDIAEELIQDDSLQGKNLRYTYPEFLNLWKTFNYEYLVLVPQGKEEIAKTIMGEDFDLLSSWKKAVKNTKADLAKNLNDAILRFNLSVALYYAGDYKNSVLEFEKVESKLTFRTLWYQIEPIQAFYELGNYPRVFSITDAILNDHNRAFSELYMIRGEIYEKQGNVEAAKKEFENAIFYNKNLKAAQQLLQSVQ